MDYYSQESLQNTTLLAIVQLISGVAGLNSGQSVTTGGGGKVADPS